MFITISREERDEYIRLAQDMSAGNHVMHEYENGHQYTMEVMRIQDEVYTGVTWYCPIQGKLYGACRCEQSPERNSPQIEFDVRTLEDTVQSLRVIVDDTDDWMRDHGALDQARDEVRASILKSAVIAADDMRRKHMPGEQHEG